MDNNKFLIIEKLTESACQKLVGGFSSVLQDPPQDTTSTKVNNCHGGNTKAGCGKKHSKKKSSVQKGTNSNCQGNCVKGCGG